METRAQLGAVPRTAIVLAVLGLLLAIFAGVMVAGTESNARAANGRIAFADAGDIYTVEPDGSDRQLIVEGTGFVQGLAWSPDGTRLAYWTDDPEPWRLTVVDADGSNPVTVASDLIGVVGNFFATPEWSPDGKSLAFTATTRSAPECDGPMGDFCSSRVFVAAADGSTGAVQVGDTELNARTVAWSPDGSTLAFGGGTTKYEIGLYLMDPDGSDIRRIDDVPGKGYAFLRLDWSPDGQRIVGTSGPEETWDIWVFAADGSGGVDVSDIPGQPNALDDQLFPSYADDGTLAWNNAAEQDGGLVLLEEGGSPIQLDGNFLVWSPDGQLIATNKGDAPADLVLVDRTGQAVSTIEAVGDIVAWQPLPG
jgi:Tol biopolymer transport system component